MIINRRAALEESGSGSMHSVGTSAGKDRVAQLQGAPTKSKRVSSSAGSVIAAEDLAKLGVEPRLTEPSMLKKKLRSRSASVPNTTKREPPKRRLSWPTLSVLVTYSQPDRESGDSAGLSGKNFDSMDALDVRPPASPNKAPIPTPRLSTANQTPDSSSLLDFETPACRRLISRAFSSREVTSLIETIFMSKDEVKMLGDLHGEAAQTLIDVVHEVRFHPLTSEPRSDYAHSPRYPRRTFAFHSSGFGSP